MLSVEQKINNENAVTAASPLVLVEKLNAADLQVEQKKFHRGFTLIEMMVVIAILAILTALIAPNVLGRAETAKITAARTNIANLESSIELYKINNANFPKSLQALEPDYIKKVKNDPWNNPYQYSASGSNYELKSFGADGEAGGEGNDADITNN